MNNQQFRKLVLDTPARAAQNDTATPTLGATPRRGDTVLGVRKRSSIPMTPRALHGHGNDFARQLADRQREASGQPTKKFKSSAAPKGTKFAPGYTDRAKARDEAEEDDKATRIKNLEEMMKLQQIDRATFERLRDDIIGGDIDAVHLMKGLDFKLLERVRRGEDVLGGKSSATEDEGQPDSDVDEEFEALEDKDIAPVQKEKVVKHGTMAPPTLISGRKRTRDAILAEMRAAREAAKARAGPTLGAKFKKVGTPRETSRIERDGKGREVLITVDEFGNEKRKVRKVQVEEEPAQVTKKGNGLLMPDKDAVPLGMVVPEQQKPAPEEDEDFDIFDDAGDDYDPLAGLAEDTDSESDKEDGEVAEKTETPAEKKESKDKFDMPPPPRPAAATAPAKPRNYFGDTTSAQEDEDKKKPAAMSDPNFLAALKKASQIAAHAKAEKSKEEAEREAKLKRMLENQDRDAADMDMGFGSSRIADEEDFGDEGKVKLSNWDGDSDEDGKKKKGGKERKRGGKKK